MDATFVGIDVSKDRLDVAVLPAGDLFVVPRDAAGLDQLLARLRPLRPEAIALEATGASRPSSPPPSAPPDCRWSSSTRPPSAPSARRSACAPRPIRSTPA